MVSNPPANLLILQINFWLPIVTYKMLPTGDFNCLQICFLKKKEDMLKLAHEIGLWGFVTTPFSKSVNHIGHNVIRKNSLGMDAFDRINFDGSLWSCPALIPKKIFADTDIYRNRSSFIVLATGGGDSCCVLCHLVVSWNIKVKYDGLMDRLIDLIDSLIDRLIDWSIIFWRTKCYNVYLLKRK